MKSRRHLSILLLVASVFLFLVSSCGIPTYIVPTTSSINSGTYVEADNTLSFSVKYAADTEDFSADHVGLLLLYYLDSVGADTNNSSNIKSKFSSQYKKSKYDGDFVTIKDNTPIFDYTVSDTQYKVYAFEIDGKAVSNPSYTLEIIENPAAYSISLEYNKDEKSVYLTCPQLPGLEYKLDFYKDFVFPYNDQGINKNYILIYGALSVQSSNYSNIYWSDLQYCGYIHQLDL